jgi:3',5'-cyclic AMP phosphodiesterase CpdA
MPLLYTSRRRILASLPFGAAVLRGAFAADTAARWALLSDTHLPADRDARVREFHIHENLSRTLAQAVAANPAGLVIDGDLARTLGAPEDYAALRRALDPVARRIPVAMALGNHDHRGNFLQAFTEHPGESAGVDKKHVLALRAGPVRLLLLDSLLHVNDTPGLLGKAQRDWLAKYLRESDNTPTLIFVHHNLGDGDGVLLDTDRLLNIVKPERKVKAIFYGHSHRYNYAEADGVHLINLPAVGYNFQASEPVGWVEASLRANGADLTLHAIAGNPAEDGRTRSLRWRA